MSKLVNLKTREVFDNRLQAKMNYGTSNFNKMYKNKVIIYLDKDTLEFLKGITLD